MNYFVYILKSISRPDKIYIGYTDDLEKRLSRHNKGMVRSTKYFVPWKIVYFEKYIAKAGAIKREKQLKKWKSRQRIESLINKKFTRR